MAERFELRTRHQFAPLVELRDRWVRMRELPEAKARFDEITGPAWGRENEGLDAISHDGHKHSETYDRSRSSMLRRHVAAVRTLLRLVDVRAFPEREDLLELHRILLSGVNGHAGEFRRRDAIPLDEGHAPTEVELIAPVIDNALEWFQSESFGEMHEVEKTALMLMKLMDVQPFEVANGLTVRLFSNFFLLKGGYLPAVIPASQASQYALAIRKSLRFDTQPIIDLIADATDRSLRCCLLEPPAPPQLRVLSS